ncbi:MAG: hypothetical protein A3A83_00080 [Candidatus Doudnabacteria bacterium RIFCSPLOWO2_01_FULL_48_57]|uniref:Uncharacterized protein n=1 Tax=Candidatus Doudnabacteria bacterium RIFCSPLOWO2_02_FULL_48_13 TaxID=1817845 RepID=A0A1F5Q9L4_9BACT|nr:MAG: hypothetical protein A3K05_01600 [Candidatus Doudnabacteria bacterium RIFCSPHIGHO2_01_48_18]OGE77063.1 MAG: hypothetical protein A2668_03015 [Candidatus Doudnabacteria bacterium RIFCSPHIGHO2_01_FULL_48_180]OGE96353.1 MAG: hypothetical protein A3A83_00080 [Candidatus Doudnabacteria bacterium RIFCSPLOWO2_01_FULL_48_57]OGE98592.1 MAG: hypothetical protein A3J05_01250 [Candidatus Doudnabacteria bacterium RIFCSPLOWO2_02_FULL_48_13]OGF00635.1 MAG: hypothetical protein A3G07_03955 [Candidatus 
MVAKTRSEEDLIAIRQNFGQIKVDDFVSGNPFRNRVAPGADLAQIILFNCCSYSIIQQQ